MIHNTENNSRITGLSHICSRPLLLRSPYFFLGRRVRSCLLALQCLCLAASAISEMCLVFEICRFNACISRINSRYRCSGSPHKLKKWLAAVEWYRVPLPQRTPPGHAHPLVHFRIDIWHCRLLTILLSNKFILFWKLRLYVYFVDENEGYNMKFLKKNRNTSSRR